MTWAAPLAWLLAIGVLGPLAAHLLSRRTPTTHAFPTLRFVRAAATSARRLRTLHDPWLLALRMAVVLTIAGAAAGPTLATSWRERQWEAPLHTAYVHAPSALATHAPGTPAPRDARAAAARTGGGGTRAWHYEGRPLRQSLAMATEDLLRLRSARRLIVVQWSGDVRELSPADLRAVPSDIGVRLEPASTPARTAEEPAPSVAIEHAPADAAAAAVLEQITTRDASLPITVVWPAAPSRDELVAEMRPATGVADGILWRMQVDPRLQDAARRSRRDARTAEARRLAPARAHPLAIGSDGDVLLWGGVWREALLLVLDAHPRDPVSLWTVRAAEDAARAAIGWPRESRRWTSEELAAHERAPGTPPAADLPEGLDTRWWWLAALVLLLAEQIIRRRPGLASHDV